MKLTNHFSLPDAVVNAVKNQPYSKGGSDMSVTELMDSPRIRALKIQHKDKIESDVNDFAFSLMGTAFHSILEQYSEPGSVSEERLYMDVGGVIISGAIDVQKVDADGRVKIVDWKTTTAYKVQNDHDSWTKQLNCYAALIRETKGVKIAGLEIVAFIRDWRKGDAEKYPNYPQATIVTIPLEVWPHADAMDYIYERVNLHLDAREALGLGEPLPQCSDEERWSKGDGYAIRKEGGVRNLKKGATYEELEPELRPGQEIVRLLSEPTRCAKYCEVAPWCSQWAEFKQEIKDKMNG